MAFVTRASPAAGGGNHFSDGPRCWMALVRVFEPWPSAAIFGLLFMLLWFVFGSVAKSVTLLVSCRLLDFPEGVAAAAIKRDVIESEFDIRAALLCDMGYVDRRNATYVIAPAGLRFLGKLRKASSFFGIESKGLYGLDR